MPVFFNKATLTPAQIEKWDWAIEEYAQIQETNLLRRYATMTQADKESYLAAHQGEYAFCGNDVLALMRVVNQQENKPGDPNSALFARLLDGKPALPVPPPTTKNDYPWYALTEEAGPFPVMVSGTVKEYRKRQRNPQENRTARLLINNCAWSILETNAAAKELLAMEALFLQSAHLVRIGPNKADVISEFTWTDAFYAQVVAAYAGKPEFTVQHLDMAPYRLTLGREAINCRRDLIEDIMRCPTKNKDLANTHTVFADRNLYLHATIGETTSQAEHPKVKLEAAQARLAAARDGVHTTKDLEIDDFYVQRHLPTLRTDTANFEARPNGHDRVQVMCDKWMLFKT